LLEVDKLKLKLTAEAFTRGGIFCYQINMAISASSAGGLYPKLLCRPCWSWRRPTAIRRDPDFKKELAGCSKIMSAGRHVIFYRHLTEALGGPKIYLKVKTSIIPGFKINNTLGRDCWRSGGQSGYC
jgi:hypothetical protein